MHELSICQGIIGVAASALDGMPDPLPPVSRVNVRVGRLTAVVPDSLRYYFELLTPGTALAGASLVIEEVPARGVCADCGTWFEIEMLTFTCPACGGGFVDLTSGRELQVVSIETGQEVACGS